MPIHFEELWEKCENFHKEVEFDEDISPIISEIVMKLKLYEAVEQKIDDSVEDKEKAKSRILGEILLTLTSLSLRDNINVYEALQIALMHHSIDEYSERY